MRCGSTPAAHGRHLGVHGQYGGFDHALRIGGNATWGEFFGGLIDNLRVYNRALSGAGIEADRTTPVT